MGDAVRGWVGMIGLCVVLVVVLVVLWNGYSDALGRVRGLEHKLSGVEAERDILRNRVDQLTKLRDKIYDLAADDCGYVDSDDEEDDDA